MIWQDGPVTVHIGDALSVLRELPAESVQCIVTSPPYWGLRDYGIPGQLGLEATPEEYIAWMVEVFGEVRRVLRPDGTLWLNMGDSYAGGTQTGRKDNGRPEKGRGWAEYDIQRTKIRRQDDLKPKDLVGIPWRLAFALQADGWWLRSDIIWAKPNPMPESVTDRPTKAHEYIFLLTKQARYFYDAEAVREPHAYPEDTNRYRGQERGEDQFQVRRFDYQQRVLNPADRNLRSVWTIATQPYPEAHFATFPEELARRCIAAGTSERGCCPECGAPWRRLMERSLMVVREGPGRAGLKAAATGGTTRTAITGTMLAPATATTTGWQPDCWCGGEEECRACAGAGWNPGAGPFGRRPCGTCCGGLRLIRRGKVPKSVGEPVSCTVLDPFAGSGTTLAVARRMERRAVGIELQADYLPLIQRRVSEAALPLLEAIT